MRGFEPCLFSLVCSLCSLLCSSLFSLLRGVCGVFPCVYALAIPPLYYAPVVGSISLPCFLLLYGVLISHLIFKVCIAPLFGGLYSCAIPLTLIFDPEIIRVFSTWHPGFYDPLDFGMRFFKIRIANPDLISRCSFSKSAFIFSISFFDFGFGIYNPHLIFQPCACALPCPCTTAGSPFHSHLPSWRSSENRAACPMSHCRCRIPLICSSGLRLRHPESRGSPDAEVRRSALPFPPAV